VPEAPYSSALSSTTQRIVCASSAMVPRVSRTATTAAASPSEVRDASDAGPVPDSGVSVIHHEHSARRSPIATTVGPPDGPCCVRLVGRA